ncbi:MAG: hypothetical protein M3070_08215 [Actinomycetota bacterium]|nr:hypothetical protein [Actinomycetota bacterium]
MTCSNRARVHGLLAAGLVDSFGLSLGWTTFILLAVTRGGLSSAGLYNAAMLAGVVCSAPVTAALARRFNGRTLLCVSGSAELVLRIGTMSALLLDCSPSLVASGVILMNVAAWTGYAGMRAEVAAADPGARAMTRYAVAIAAIEAVGASVAALLPISVGGGTSATVVSWVIVLYGASVVPQFVCARGALVRSGRDLRFAIDGGGSGAGAVSGIRNSLFARHDRREPVARRRLGRQPILLSGGAVIMLLASGPTTLSTALAAELYGHVAVVVSAITFSAGCLFASSAGERVARLRLPTSIGWPVWGAGMLAGWIFAPWNIVGLLAAQFFSGLSMTAFQGEMDARVAASAEAGRVTSALAWAAAMRASGSAVAVRLLPVLIAAPSVGRLSVVSVGVLTVGAVLALGSAEARKFARHDARHARVRQSA